MNTRIQALIVDDETPGRINLRYALAEHLQWQVAGECTNVASARAFLADNPVDVVFLDIQMPIESGLGLAQSLSKLAEPPLIIFVTAYNTHAVTAFELHALDYLLKPFDDQRLAQALERATTMLAQRQQANYGRALQSWAVAEERGRLGVQDYWQQVSVRSVGMIECIQLSDVLWIEAAGNYMQLHLSTRCLLHRVPLAQLEKHLDPDIFMRVHRSAIVRTDQLASLSSVGDGSYLLGLRCGDTAAVSERYAAGVKARMRDQNHAVQNPSSR